MMRKILSALKSMKENFVKTANLPALAFALAAIFPAVSVASAAETPATPMTMTQILSTIGEIFTALIGWVADAANAITGSPIIMIFVVIGLVFTVVSILKRLTNV